MSNSVPTMQNIRMPLFVAAILPALAPAQTNSLYSLDPVYIEASPISRYHVDSVASSTYFDVPPAELPVSVDVLTGDFIREQNPGDLHDLLFFQPGVSGGAKSMMDRTSGQYSIRGQAGSTPSLDGTLPLAGAMGMFLDPGALEQIEIVKGPVGALQGGQTSTLGPYGAGGAVNLILKHPHPAASFTKADLRAAAGSHARQLRLGLDLNRPASETLTLRLPAGISLTRPFWLPSGHDEGYSFFTAPSLLWEPSETLRLGLASTLQITDAPGYQGVPSFRGKPLAPYEWDSYVAGDNDLRDEYAGYSVQGFAEWDVSEIWQLRGGAGFAGSNMEFEHIGSSTYAQQKGVPVVDAYDLNWADRNSQVYNVHGRSIVRYSALGAFHTTLFQLDATTTRSHGRVANALLPSPAAFRPLPKGDFTDTTLDRYGTLVQEHAEIGILRLLAGARFDRHESDLGNSGNGLSPRAGLALVPTTWMTIFGNFSRTEAPNFGYMHSATEELTSAWQADQYEAGIRVSPRKTLWLTVALYRIDQSDTPSYDDATGYYVTEGKSENRGIETTIAGNLTENWSLHLAYAYIDAVAQPGERSLDPHPPHSASLQTAYRISGGLFKELTLSAGYRYRHGYDGTMRGEYVGPDYFFRDTHVLDLSVQAPLSKFGGQPGLSVQLAVKNVFNESYFESNRHYYQCFTGEPRTLEIALRGEF